MIRETAETFGIITEDNNFRGNLLYMIPCSLLLLLMLFELVSYWGQHMMVKSYIVGLSSQ